MENGVNKVEEVKSKVEEVDKDVLGDGVKGIEIDDAFEAANGGVESVSETVEVEETVDRKDRSVENGRDSGVSLKLEDALETPCEIIQKDMETAHVDPVEEVVSMEVIDNAIKDQPIAKENDELVDCDDSEEHEGKVLDFTEVTEDRNESANTFSDPPSGLEANDVVDDDDSEAKVVHDIDGESTSDNAARNQASDLETGVSMVGGKDDDIKMADVTDVSVDEPNMLENNGVIDNGVVNEVRELSNEGQMATLEDTYEDNKNPDALNLENSENGVSDNVDLDETVILEDSEIGVEANGDLHEGVNEKDDESSRNNEAKDDESSRNIEAKDDESSRNIEVKDDESSRNNEVKDDESSRNSEVKDEQTQEKEQKSFDSSSRLEDDKNPQQGSSSSAINEPDNQVKSFNLQASMEETTVTPNVEKSELEVKQNIPIKKEQKSTPVSNPKHDPKPNQFPIPNSKPTTTPTPAAPSSSPAQPRPAGLGSGAPLLEPAHRVAQSQPNGNASPMQNQVIDEPTNGEVEENDDTREKLQMIRVKFLRLARRLGQTPHNVVVAQVLYRLGLAEQLRGRNGGRVAAFSFERASAMAEQLEAAGQEPLEFSCTIMVLGKTGVGKSATINSIFDEVKFGTDAFQSGTKKVQDVVGMVQGIKVRVIDTPGLLPSWADQRKNEKILHSVKRFIQKSPPDIVLYLDRLDMQSRDFGDMPLLRTITDIFGQSIWFNAIVVLTHAASAPPEGPNGTTTSYDMFVTQRSHVVQQAIRQAAGDMRLMNPVSLVENHTACRTNRAGQRVLPNGQVWKPHLLLLSFASKILVEANMLLKLQDSPPGKPFAPRARQPPLPFILSNLLQSRPQLTLPNDDVDDDDDDVDDDDVDKYDELPPFKRLTSAQLAKLSKSQRKAYYDELEYRETLFMKKQLKEERKRRKMMKKMAEASISEVVEEEDSNAAATVPVAVQDMNLPVSFDSDNPTHRYRALDSAHQWLIRPVLDPHGWDHDVGYEGINIEHLLALKEKIPVSFSGQVTKDKKDANLQMEVSTAVKHGRSKSKSTTVAFDMQTVGKDLSYTLRSETRFLNFKKNKASAGFSVTQFGDTLTGGLKFEDKLIVNKRGQVVVAGGAVMGRGDVAYGGSLEATLKDKDYPLGRFLSTVGLSVMDWHGDLALGWNGQTQIPIGRFTNLIGRVNLNNKGSGQVSVRLNSSEQLQIALVALVPILSKVLGYYQPRDSSY